MCSTKHVQSFARWQFTLNISSLDKGLLAENSTQFSTLLYTEVYILLNQCNRFYMNFYGRYRSIIYLWCSLHIGCFQTQDKTCICKRSVGDKWYFFDRDQDHHILLIYLSVKYFQTCHTQRNISNGNIMCNDFIFRKSPEK